MQLFKARDRKPKLELLEDRLVLTSTIPSFNVTNGNDDGIGSLRNAVEAANEVPGFASINILNVDTIFIDEVIDVVLFHRN